MAQINDPQRGRTLRLGSLVVLGIAAAEVIIMISPFAGLFYARSSFGFLFEVLAGNPYTAWLNGFFLNHSVITRSLFLEIQREIGEWMLLGGIFGFAMSAKRLYTGKAKGAGVVDGSFYRLVRHPQYMFLAIAGWGLLTGWPRFLLLWVWVTMMFLYAGLSRFEESQMQAAHPESYEEFSKARGAFLPGSPVRRLFEATFGRVRPAAAGWALAYLFCLVVAFSSAFALRSYVIKKSAILMLSERNMMIVSVWPEPDDWMMRVVEAGLTEDVRLRLETESNGLPIVATILTPNYGMRDMYYKVPRVARPGTITISGFPALYRTYMGDEPEQSNEPVEIVFSRADKTYQSGLSLSEVLDPGVRLVPLAMIEVDPSTGEVSDHRIPLPQNAWGEDVVMPVL